jgi:hypothetical protein
MILYAAINGYLDDVPVDKISAFETSFHRFMEANHPKLGDQIAKDKDINPEIAEKLKTAIAEFKKDNYPGEVKESKKEEAKAEKKEVKEAKKEIKEEKKDKTEDA